MRSPLPTPQCQACQTAVCDLLPLVGFGIPAIEDENGDIQTDPAVMASLLRRHWGRAFAEKPCRDQDVHRWTAADRRATSGLREALLPMVQDGVQWDISLHDVREAIRRTASSAPGPDGIPYAAWRRLGPLAETCIYEAAKCLEGDQALELLERAHPKDTHGNSAFNDAKMVFLPKRTPYVNPGGQ